MDMRYIWPIPVHRICLILFLTAAAPLRAQTDPWSSWDAGTVRELSTAADLDYLDEEEKKVILFMNLARYNGPLFAETFLESYLREKQMDNNSYVKSLRRDLKKQDRLAPLIPEKDLFAVAVGHALQSGKQGRTGHQGFKQRFEPLLGNPYTHVGENCSYGYEQAIDIVLGLLIDEGVKDLGHRHNILSADFNSVGVAIRPHKRYRTNCVMDFGARNRSSLNDVPF
jgi:uncharacterized protein YkwD